MEYLQGWISVYGLQFGLDEAVKGKTMSKDVVVRCAFESNGLQKE